MSKRFPLPKSWWICVFSCLICAILLFYNIFRTGSWNGDISFSEYTKSEWILFIVFIIEELILICLMFLFTFLIDKICKRRRQEIAAEREQNKFAGIKPGDYDYVWFDYICSERALILKQGEKYVLYVHEYDEYTGEWKEVNQMDIYDSLENLKKNLFFEFDFYCEENALLDKQGNEIYKES